MTSGSAISENCAASTADCIASSLMLRMTISQYDSIEARTNLAKTTISANAL